MDRLRASGWIVMLASLALTALRSAVGDEQTGAITEPGLYELISFRCFSD